MNPFISFCLYVAARVFVQYLKSRPKDSQVKASLQFLLSAMHAIKRKNPLTESFLVQLDVDLEHAGLEDSQQLRVQMDQLMKSTLQNPTRSEGCPMSEWLGMDKMNKKGSGQPTYGDNGLAAFTHPRQGIVDPVSKSPTSSAQSFAYNQQVNGTSQQFNLPNRQRTPGTYQSPSNYQMDTTPDGSSNNDQNTPGSSTQSGANQNPSSHTSHTGYSPQNQQQNPMSSNDLAGITGIFDPNDPSFANFSTDFNMHDFPPSAIDHQQQGFVLPQNWGGGGSSNSGTGGTGLTPGSGASMGGHGMMAGFQGNGVGDLMSGMSEAEWNQMLESFTASG